jgi:hypothetical protein
VGVHPAARSDLIASASTEYFGNYLLTAGDQVIVDGMKAGRGSAARRFDIIGAQYSAYLDVKTCALCASLNNRIVTVPSEEFQAISPPHHRHCRCQWIYITREESDFEPDPDVFAFLQRVAAEERQTIGEFLVSHAHENELLQSYFKPSVDAARADIAARKAARAAKRVQARIDGIGEEDDDGGALGLSTVGARVLRRHVRLAVPLQTALLGRLKA